MRCTLFLIFVLIGIFSNEAGEAVKYLLAYGASFTICPQHFVLSLFCFIFLLTLRHFEIRHLDILLCSLYCDAVVSEKVILAFSLNLGHCFSLDLILGISHKFCVL